MDTPKRPRLVIPGSSPAPVPTPAPITATTTAPAPEPEVPTAVPAEAQPQPQPAPVMMRRKSAVSAPEPAPEPVAAIPVVAAAVENPEPVDEPVAAKTKTSPQPLTPPEGSKPSVHSTIQEIVPTAEAVPVAVAATPTRGIQTQPVVPPQATPAPLVKPKRKKMSNTAKTMIAAVLGLVVVLLGVFLLNRSGQNRENKRYNDLIQLAAKSDATEVPMNSVDFDILLRAVTFTGAVDEERRQVIYKALFLAKATDGSDFDAILTDFATGTEMLPAVRETLLAHVLRKRGNPSIVPKMLEYARTSSEPEDAVSALQGIRFLVTDEHIDPLVELIQTTPHDPIRKEAETAASEIIRDSTNRAALATKLVKAYSGSVNENARHAVLRLVGRCGGNDALAVAKTALGGSEKDQVAALLALGSWGDDTAFPLLSEYLQNPNVSPQMRGRAFQAAMSFASAEQRGAGPQQEAQWRQLALIASDSREKEMIIRAIVNRDDPWVEGLLTDFTKDPDNRAQDVAEKALRYREEAKKADEEAEGEPAAPDQGE